MRSSLESSERGSASAPRSNEATGFREPVTRIQQHISWLSWAIEAVNWDSISLKLGHEQ
jgi:hypothetical protein